MISWVAHRVTRPEPRGNGMPEIACVAWVVMHRNGGAMSKIGAAERHNIQQNGSEQLPSTPDFPQLWAARESPWRAPRGKGGNVDHLERGQESPFTKESKSLLSRVITFVHTVYQFGDTWKGNQRMRITYEADSRRQQETKQLLLDSPPAHSTSRSSGHPSPRSAAAAGPGRCRAL